MAVSYATAPAPAQVYAPSPSYKGAMAMVTTLFFMWGFLTCLNDILIPHLKAIFDLNYTQVMLIQFCFFTSYFVFAAPSGKLIEKIGYKQTMVSGLFTMALGAVLFIPAASLPSFLLFLTALIVLAAGMTQLQVSANPYVAVLGPAEGASSRLNLTQAFNSLGTTLAPYFGSLLILSAAPKTADEIRQLAASELHAYRLHEAASVKLPYLGLAVALMVLGVIIARFKLPVIAEAGDTGSSAAPGSIWKQRHLVLGAIGIFVYVGAEVSIGSFLVNYLSQPEIGGVSLQMAAKLVSLYWGGAMVGRFFGSALLRRIQAGKLLGLFAIVAALLVCTSMLTNGHMAMATILLVGLFNSVMFPSIFTLSIAGLGALTSRGSGLLVAAIVGGAIIPEVQGLLADRMGIQHALFLPVLCYIYIAFFAFKGSQPRTAAAA